MKRLFTFLFLLITVASTACNQSSIGEETPEYSAEQKELIALSEQWNDALERKDIPALERFLAAEFYVSPQGMLDKTDRSTWLKNVSEMDWNSLKYRSVKVDFYGDTAVMTSLIDFKVTTKSGIPISTDTQIADVWVRRSGQWQVAARHLGAASIEGWLRLIGGFVAGLGLCFFVWLIFRFKRRSAAKRSPANDPAAGTS